MKGHKYIITSSLMLLMANSFIGIRGAGFRKAQCIAKSTEGRIPKKREHRVVYQDYYQDSEIPANYELDYYPYKSYAYESNEEEPFEENYVLEKKHKTKRRGSKEKELTSKINRTQKSKIKSQKKSKSNLKTKTRRNVQEKNDYGQKDGNENNRKFQREAFSTPINSLLYNIQPSVYLPQQNLFHDNNYTNNIEQKTLSHPVRFAEMYNMERFKPETKISPYDYLHIHNRSHNDFSDLHESSNTVYEFLPKNFNLRSLSEVLGESNVMHKTYFPQCPAVYYSNNENYDSGGHHSLENNKAEFSKENRREKINYSDAVNGENYFGKNQERRNEEYEDKAILHDIRAKREQKLKTFTLSFPAVENIISLKEFPNDQFGHKGKMNKSGNLPGGSQCPPITFCSTTPSQCTTIPICITTPSTCSTTCLTEETSECTTTPKCTTTEICTTESAMCEEVTESKCPHITTCPSNFKELNEGNRILMDLSSYVSNMFHSNAYNSSSKNLSNKKQKVNYEGKAPLSLKNKYNVIKLNPHHIMQRSNEIPDELKNNIYIVKLLKDLSSSGKVSEIPLQSQKSFFSVPYAPRLRRQLKIRHRQRNSKNVKKKVIEEKYK